MSYEGLEWGQLSGLVDLGVVGKGRGVYLSIPRPSPTPPCSTPPLIPWEGDWTQRQASSRLLILDHTQLPGVLFPRMIGGTIQ